MSHKKKNKKYVIIDAKFGNNERFLGNRVHPGLSAAIGWCEKHYPEESKKLEDNFSLRCIGHEKLTALFLDELDTRLPKGTMDRELLLSMAKSLVQGRGIRSDSTAKATRMRPFPVKGGGRAPSSATKPESPTTRSFMSRLFRFNTQH